MKARMVNVTEVGRVLAELKVARMFTRAFWPQGRVTSALVEISMMLKQGEIKPREAEKAAYSILERCMGVGA